MNDEFDLKEIQRTENQMIRNLYEENEKKDKIIQNAIDLIYGISDVRHSSCKFRDFLDFSREDISKYCFSGIKCIDCVRKHIEEI